MPEGFLGHEDSAEGDKRDPSRQVVRRCIASSHRDGYLLTGLIPQSQTGLLSEFLPRRHPVSVSCPHIPPAGPFSGSLPCPHPVPVPRRAAVPADG